MTPSITVRLFAAAALFAVPLLAESATAQSAPPQPTMVIYGNQRCPTDNDGNEIIVCERRSQAEQFRIPRELRDFHVTAANSAWASRAVENQHVADAGIGSCSTVGPGGQSGCFLRSVQRDRQENRDRQQTQQDVESNLP